MFVVKVITGSDDLDKIVAEINQSSWDDKNDMSPYDVDSLSAYLARQDTVFLTCHDTQPAQPVLLGIASSRFEMKPYEKALWLYVDEVDVCADQRKKGVGKLIMRKLFEIAKEKGCEEVWLGAEVENVEANALYRALKPDDIADVVGYNYEIGASD